MISFDAIRAAVLSELPWTRLDELVRADLAEGRSTKELFDELRALSKEIPRIEGVTPDGIDAFGDTLDALVGFCPADYAYENVPPNKTTGQR